MEKQKVCDRVWLPGPWQVEFRRNDNWLFSVWAGLIAAITGLGGFVMIFLIKQPVIGIVRAVIRTVVMLVAVTKSTFMLVGYGFMGYAVTLNRTREEAMVSAMQNVMNKIIESQRGRPN